MIEGVTNWQKEKKKSKSKARPKKTKKKQKSFLLFPKFFQKWSLIFIGLFAYWDS